MTPVIQLVTALAVLAGIGYVLWRPHWAVLAIIVMFPLEQLLTATFPVLNDRSWLFNVGVGFLALFALAGKLLRGGGPTIGYQNPVTYMIAGLYLLAAVSLIWTPSDLALGFMKTGLPYYGLYLVLMPLLITDLYEFRRLMLGFMIVGTIIAALIMVNPNSAYYSGRLVLDLGMYAGESRSNPLTLAKMGAMMALVGALLTFERKTTALTILKLTAVLVGLGLAIGSGSRGQVLAVVLTGIVAYPAARRLHNPQQFFVTAFGFLFFAGVVFITFKLFIGDQNAGRWAVDAMFRDIGQRFDFVWELTSAYLSSPGYWVFGLGANAFNAVYPGGGYVHNVACEIVCEEGLVGAALLLGMIVFTSKAGLRLFATHRHDPSMRSTVVLLGATCAFGMLLSLKQGTILKLPDPFYWWLLLAKLAHYERLVQAEAGVEDPAAEYEGADDYATEEGLVVAG